MVQDIVMVVDNAARGGSSWPAVAYRTPWASASVPREQQGGARTLLRRLGYRAARAVSTGDLRCLRRTRS